MYDVLADEEKFREHDQWIGRFAASLDQSRPYTTREFLYLLGCELGKHAKEDGIVSAAAKAGVPLYCPAVADSSIGIGIAANRYAGGNRFTFDVIGDVVETARIVAESHATGVIYFGGGTPKNFVQQTEVTAIIMNTGVTGHKYAVQCVTDAAHWGGLSGCTFEEAQSWGKIAKDASMVTCHSDSTIAMPILVSALLEHQELIANRKPPEFKMGRGGLPARAVVARPTNAGHRSREQSGGDRILRAEWRWLSPAVVHTYSGSRPLWARDFSVGFRDYERAYAGGEVGSIFKQKRKVGCNTRGRSVVARLPCPPGGGMSGVSWADPGLGRPAREGAGRARVPGSLRHRG
jgi:hypothetical protein